MVFEIFSCIFVKEIQNEVSACFYEITQLFVKFLPLKPAKNVHCMEKIDESKGKP